MKLKGFPCQGAAWSAVSLLHNSESYVSQIIQLYHAAGKEIVPAHLPVSSFIISLLVYEAEKCSADSVSGPSHSHHEHIWDGSGIMDDPGCLCSIWSPHKAKRHLMEATNLWPAVSPTHDLALVWWMGHFLSEHSSYINLLYIYSYVCILSRLSRWLVYRCLLHNFQLLKIW